MSGHMRQVLALPRRLLKVAPTASRCQHLGFVVPTTGFWVDHSEFFNSANRTMVLLMSITLLKKIQDDSRR